MAPADNDEDSKTTTTTTTASSGGDADHQTADSKGLTTTTTTPAEATAVADANSNNNTNNSRPILKVGDAFTKMGQGMGRMGRTMVDGVKQMPKKTRDRLSPVRTTTTTTDDDDDDTVKADNVSTRVQQQQQPGTTSTAATTTTTQNKNGNNSQQATTAKQQQQQQQQAGNNNNNNSNKPANPKTATTATTVDMKGDPTIHPTGISSEPLDLNDKDEEDASIMPPEMTRQHSEPGALVSKRKTATKTKKQQSPQQLQQPFRRFFNNNNNNKQKQQQQQQTENTATTERSAGYDDDEDSKEQGDAVSPLPSKRPHFADHALPTTSKDARGANNKGRVARFDVNDTAENNTGDNASLMAMLVIHVWWISIAIAAVPTRQHWSTLQAQWEEAEEEKKMTLQTGLLWLLVAYLTGHVLSLERLASWAWSLMVLVLPKKVTDKLKSSATSPPVQAVRRTISIFHQSMALIAQTIQDEEDEDEQDESVASDQAAAAASVAKAAAAPDGKTTSREVNHRRRNPVRWIQRKTNRVVRGVTALVNNNNSKNNNNISKATETSAGTATAKQQRQEQQQDETAATTTTTTRTRRSNRRNTEIYTSLSETAVSALGESTTSTVTTKTNMTEKHVGRRPSWLDRVDPLKRSIFPNPFLMQQLLNNQKLHRRAAGPNVQEEETGTTTTVTTGNDTATAPTTTAPSDKPQPCKTNNDDGATQRSPLGHKVEEPRDSFQEFQYVINPILQLRGMDIFMTENAEYDITQNAWFQQHGLRDVPTLICNGVTQWGNILIYFELPKWIKNLTTSLEEQPNDTDDVRALKRFFTGTDEYRNQRLKMIPSVADGPMAVKVLAPPKKERIIHGTIVPISWYMHDVDTVTSPSTTTTGTTCTTTTTLQPAIVCALDCASGRAIRSMANIIKKYMVKLTIDLALVIGSPMQAGEDPAAAAEREAAAQHEPHACLGLFRFEKIDVTLCPDMPLPPPPPSTPAFTTTTTTTTTTDENEDDANDNSSETTATTEEEQEESRDILQAQRLSGISNQELWELQKEDQQQRRLSNLDVIEETS